MAPRTTRPRRPANAGASRSRRARKDDGSTSGRSPRIVLHRIYDVRGPHRRYRVLVDRLWPRGVKKEDAALDEWLKDVAPSDGLRRWYGHDERRFAEFASRYRAELGQVRAAAAVRHLVDVSRRRQVELVTATRDLSRSAARVLAEHVSHRVG